MKKFKYIAVLAALFTAMACSETEVEGISKLNNGKQIQVVGRVLPFTDCNVNSRSIKTDNEINISCMSLVIFDDNGKCVHLEYINSSSPVFVVNREDLADSYEVSKAKMYVFANTPEIQPGETFQTDNLASYDEDTFLKTVNAVSGIDIPKIGGIECFPMVGKLTVDLETAATEILEIPLYALYAKIVMNIKVTPDQSIPGKNSASFRLDGYTVHNVASSVDFKGSNVDSEGKETVTSDATPVLDGTFEGSISGSNIAQGATDVQFSFYLPERYLQPETTAAEYNYPFKGTFDATTDKDQNGIRDEDENYRQRFKPELVKDNNPAATFVRFFGEYIDHQGHNYNVSYDIYVGSDNYGNFDVVRNTQYNNYITIRGLANSNDQALNKDAISIDHRVDVERVNPIIINFRRETLLDSHFEVRPLRIRKNPEFTGDVSNAKVKVEVVYNDTPASNWIGLERSFGNGTEVSSSTTYLVDNDLAADRKNAAGKRKYFTTNLTTNALAGTGTFDENGFSTAGGTTVIVPVTDNNQCIWMYVDECTEADDDVRSATIRVSYSTDGETWNEDHKIDYIINQRKLFPVTFTENNTSRNYNIEYHEEYLYNYDAEDQYGQTEYEGMAWGAENVQFSEKYPAVYVDLTGGLLSWLDDIGWDFDEMMNNIIQSQKPYYDFYLTRDKNALSLTEDSNYDDETSDGIIIRDYSGHTFSNEIITKLASLDKISSGTLASTPLSAVEYCYNKNKRNENGVVENVVWYLPGIDEMEEIVTSQYKSENITQDTYARFLEFQDKFYWSSQPAYVYNDLKFSLYIWLFGKTRLGTAEGKLFIDNIGNAEANDPGFARATSVSYKNGDYTAEPSGISGATNDVYMEYYNELQDPVTTPKATKPTPEEGYMSRTDMARIRCVRKN